MNMTKEDKLNIILENCKNYDEIIKYSINENDDISKTIIRYYQDYVFFNWDRPNKLQVLDDIVFTYIKERDFYNYIQSKYDEELVLPLYDYLINLTHSYQIDSIKKVENTKWL